MDTQTILIIRKEIQVPMAIEHGTRPCGWWTFKFLLLSADTISVELLS